MIPLPPLALLLKFVRGHCDLVEQTTAVFRSDSESRSAFVLTRELRRACDAVEAEMPVAMVALKQLAERADGHTELRGALDTTMAVLTVEGGDA